MARNTRSKKVEVAEDHTALASQTPLPDTPAKTLGSLAEIQSSTGMNRVSMSDDAIASEVKGLKAAYKAAIGIGKKNKKSKSKKKSKNITTIVEDAADDTPTSCGGDSPVPEATRLLLQSREGSLRSLLDNAVLQSGLTQAAEYNPIPEMVEQPVIAPRNTRWRQAEAELQAQAANGAHANQNMAAQNMAFEDVVAQDVADEDVAAVSTPQAATTRSVDAQNQQLAASECIQSPSRSPIRTLAEVERVYGPDDSATLADDTGEDSFVQQITARSPAKPVSRIEDSVEALDKLEEALDALKEAALAENIVSPEKKRQQRPLPFDDIAKMHNKVQGHGVTKSQPPKIGAATMRVKSTAPRPSILKKATSMTFKPSPTELSRSSSVQSKPQPPKAKAPVKRPLSLMPPKETAKSTKPPTRSTFELPGEAVARRLKEQKEARLAQRESSEDSFHTARAVSGSKTKSTKPPTYPTFELPGEALSRRKREAHEARLKAQEEEERKRREFKAKPIRKSVVPGLVPRETIASRARQSRVGLENMDIDDISISKRGSNVGAHRPSMLELSKANVSAPRAKAPVPTRKPTPTTHGPSMSGRAMQRTVSPGGVQIQRQRARDIYNRDSKMAEDMERERREREAAAKNAREAAAERGRQASREWAEKQMAKKLAEGDKGMSAGYGPGGQMGLSH